MKALYLFLVPLISTTVLAAPKQKIPDSQTLKNAELHNQIQSNSRSKALALPNSISRPFADYEKTRYLIFNADGNFDSSRVKRSILKNLPQGVDVVVLAPITQVTAVKNQFTGYIPDSRLHVVGIKNYDESFWARDALPLPVFQKNTSKLGLVDARYYHGFPQDKRLAQLFSASLYSHSYYYEGGNFQSDDQGNCFMINNNLARQIPDQTFTSYYGCKKVVRLAHLAGIGHVDEVIRIVGPQKVLTTHTSYKTTLEKLGYQVTLLPQPTQQYETYANSLIINGTVFLPIYNEAKDQEAIDIYKSFGFNVVPIETRQLSNEGLGSIHCITMQYPETPFYGLVSTLARALEVQGNLWPLSRATSIQ